MDELTRAIAKAVHEYDDRWAVSIVRSIENHSPTQVMFIDEDSIPWVVTVQPLSLP